MSPSTWGQRRGVTNRALSAAAKSRNFSRVSSVSCRLLPNVPGDTNESVSGPRKASASRRTTPGGTGGTRRTPNTRRVRGSTKARARLTTTHATAAARPPSSSAPPSASHDRTNVTRGVCPSRPLPQCEEGRDGDDGKQVGRLDRHHEEGARGEYRRDPLPGTPVGERGQQGNEPAGEDGRDVVRHDARGVDDERCRWEQERPRAHLGW